MVDLHEDPDAGYHKASTYKNDGGYAVVPRKLLHSKVSPRAIILYAHIALLTNNQQQIVVYRKTLAAKMGVSLATVKRDMAELVEAKALIKQERFREDGAQLGNLYTIPEVIDLPPELRRI